MQALAKASQRKGPTLLPAHQSETLQRNLASSCSTLCTLPRRPPDSHCVTHSSAKAPGCHGPRNSVEEGSSYPTWQLSQGAGTLYDRTGWAKWNGKALPCSESLVI